MEWSKIKTILIWIFVIVNIFLFSMYFRDMYAGNEISDDVVSDTITVLAKNNVEITEDVMPRDLTDVKIFNVEKKYNSISELIENVKKTSSGNGIAYFNDENVSVRGRNFTCTVNSNGNVSDTEDHAEEELEKTGLLSDVDYSVRKSGEYVYFYLKHDNMIFFDSYIRVKCTNKGIQEIYGNNWYCDKITEGSMAQTISPAQVLIDFAVQMQFEQKVKITKVEAGYYIGNREESVRVTAFPVWEISVSDGSVYYYDRRNGDLVYTNKQ
ncbi:MAG: two-component system regulatory protein YycI [Clostridia bacterium]|nr:two-component system regulatory protein YycI [Clostridia bacterium]